MTGAKIRLAAARGGAVLLAGAMMVFAVSHGCGKSAEEGEIVQEPAAAAAEEAAQPEPAIPPSEESTEEVEVAEDLEADEAAVPAVAAPQRAVRNRRGGNRAPNDFLPATKAGPFLGADDDLLSTMQQQLAGPEEDEDEQPQQGVVR
jgi:hypothetical protein